MKKNIFSVLVLLALALAVGSAFVGCKSGGDEAEVFPFDGIYDGGGYGFIFYGAKVIQYGANNSQAWTNPGTFTYTDTTITFVTQYRTWTMGYTLTSTYIELSRLPGDTDNWYGKFSKH